MKKEKHILYNWECLLYSFSDNIKTFRDRIIISKDNIDTNLVAKRKNTVGCSWRDKESRKDKMNGNAGTPYHISLCYLQTHYLGKMKGQMLGLIVLTSDCCCLASSGHSSTLCRTSSIPVTGTWQSGIETVDTWQRIGTWQEATHSWPVRGLDKGHIKELGLLEFNRWDLRVLPTLDCLWF